mgnify:FL=1
MLFRSEGLTAGERRVQVEAPGFRTATAAVEAGTTTGAVNIVLERPPGSVHLVVVGPDGPVEDAQARFSGPEEMPPLSVERGEQDLILSPGRWQVVVSSPGYGVQSREVLVSPERGAPLRVEVTLAPVRPAAGVLGIPVICTEQYVKGLGHTVPEVRDALPAGAFVAEKTRFSALVDPVRSHLRSLHRPHVLVCGVEAHVCVLQSVLDLVGAGWTVFHATDAISAGQSDQVAPAFRRMERAGALPTGTLGAMYEWMADAAHPSFRDVLAIAKQVRKEG